jgi:hypothetical protein
MTDTWPCGCLRTAHPIEIVADCRRPHRNGLHALLSRTEELIASAALAGIDAGLKSPLSMRAERDAAVKRANEWEDEAQRVRLMFTAENADLKSELATLRKRLAERDAALVRATWRK